MLPTLLPLLATLAAVVPTSPESSNPLDYPHQILKTRSGLEAMVMLPDAAAGFYRGSRFDWSGHIAEVRLEKHKYFGLWRIPHNPQNFEHGVGPCDEFGLEDPPGYREAKPGESFLKIGVAVLRRADDKPYRFFENYEVVGRGKWRVEADDKRARTVQTIDDVDGWGIEYEKTIEAESSIDRNKGPNAGKTDHYVTLSRRLKNTGKKRIQTTHYNHNFIRFDDEPVDSNYTMTVPRGLEIVAAQRDEAGRLLLKADNSMKPKAAITQGVLFKYTGQPRDKNLFSLVIANTKTNAVLQIDHFYEVSELRLYLAPTAFCPEPFMPLDLQPGDEARWRTVYTFRIAKPER
jgi:hypothetical protein